MTLPLAGDDHGSRAGPIATFAPVQKSFGKLSLARNSWGRSKGRKRHIVTDTDGNLLAARVHTADVQDRDGAAGVIGDAKDSFPTLSLLYADGGYAGNKLELEMLKTNGPIIEIVRRADGVKGFVVIARRWVVERTLAWIGRCRRLAKDWENSIASSEAWTLIASIRRLSRRIARQAKQVREF